MTIEYKTLNKDKLNKIIANKYQEYNWKSTIEVENLHSIPRRKEISYAC